MIGNKKLFQMWWWFSLQSKINKRSYWYTKTITYKRCFTIKNKFFIVKYFIRHAKSLNNCGIIGNLSFDNNLIHENSNSYINGLYNTLSASQKTTITILRMYQSYIALINTTLSNTVYFKYKLQVYITLICYH